MDYYMVFLIHGVTTTQFYYYMVLLLHGVVTSWCYVQEDRLIDDLVMITQCIDYLATDDQKV